MLFFTGIDNEMNKGEGIKTHTECDSFKLNEISSPHVGTTFSKGLQPLIPTEPLHLLSSLLASRTQKNSV